MLNYSSEGCNFTDKICNVKACSKTWAVVQQETKVDIIDLKNLKTLNCWPEKVTSTDFACDSSLLAAVTKANDLVIYNVNSKNVAQTLSLANDFQTSMPTCCAIDPPGKYVAVGSVKEEIKGKKSKSNEDLVKDDDDSSNLVFNVYDTRKLVQPLMELSSTHSDTITGLCFHPNDSNKILSCSEDGLMCINDLAMTEDNDQLIDVFSANNTINRCCWLQDGEEVVGFLTSRESEATIYPVREQSWYSCTVKCLSNEKEESKSIFAIEKITSNQLTYLTLLGSENQIELGCWSKKQFIPQKQSMLPFANQLGGSFLDPSCETVLSYDENLVNLLHLRFKLEDLALTDEDLEQSPSGDSCKAKKRKLT